MPEKPISTAVTERTSGRAAIERPEPSLPEPPIQTDRQPPSCGQARPVALVRAGHHQADRFEIHVLALDQRRPACRRAARRCGRRSPAPPRAPRRCRARRRRPARSARTCSSTKRVAPGSSPQVACRAIKTCGLRSISRATHHLLLVAAGKLARQRRAAGAPDRVARDQPLGMSPATADCESQAAAAERASPHVAQAPGCRQSTSCRPRWSAPRSAGCRTSPPPRERPRSAWRRPSPPSTTRPELGRKSGQRLGELDLSVAVDARDRQDLAGVHLETRPRSGRCVPVASTTDKSLHRKQGCARASARRGSSGSVTSRPTIMRASSARRSVRDRAPARDPAIAQHDHIIADLQHLAELVGDEDRAFALRPSGGA